VPRRLLTLAAVASLVLCVATVALWVRSYCRADVIGYQSHGERRLGVVRIRVSWIHSNVGELAFVAETIAMASGSAPTDSRWEYVTRAAGREGTLAASTRDFVGVSSDWFGGFGFARASGRADPPVRGLCLPHWFVALIFAVLPVVRLRSSLRSRTLRRDARCPACGYDLRATPERCPECGAVPAAPAAR
jgi:hypothetical protein